MSPVLQKPEVNRHLEVLPALSAGIMATLVGIGLARFSYTPLIPVLIQAQWFNAGDAVYLGAANLLGYFVGALTAYRLTERFSPRAVVGLSLMAVAASFLLCAWPAGFYWFFSWRLISGIAGGLLMVVVPSMALSCAPASRRALVGTVVFSGVGVGAVVSALVVPALLSFDLTVTWLVLGLLATVCGFACDQGFRRIGGIRQPAAVTTNGITRHRSARIAVGLILTAYGLDAAGFIPHTVFWVDYLARENGFGQTAASLQWAVFGAGALCGPLLASRLVARFGWSRSLLLAFGFKALAILLPLLSLAFVSQTISSFVVGMLAPGLTALASGRLAEIVGPAHHKRVWGQATAAFALAQAVSGYCMSAAYDAMTTYTPLYGVASVMLVMGTVLVFASTRYTRTDPAN